MKIYTKTGDKGYTGTVSGTRVKKNSDIIKANGSIDELNAHIGMLISKAQSPELIMHFFKDQEIVKTTQNIMMALGSIQNDLFRIGTSVNFVYSYSKVFEENLTKRSCFGIILRNQLDEILENVSNNPISKKVEKYEKEYLRKQDVDYLENLIDALESKLPQLKNFILPSGDQIICQTHISRSVCRRVEIDVINCFDSFMDETKNFSQDRFPFNQINYFIQYFNRLSDFLFCLARYFSMVSNHGDKYVKY